MRRGLLPAPDGAGRGSRYTQRHLDTLIRIRDLQEAGVPLAEIAVRLTGQPPMAVPLSAAPSPVSYSTWTRVEIEDGVELHLRNVRLDSEKVRALGEAVRRILDQGEKP